MDISLKQGKLTTFVHYKATDSHSHLDYRSSHNPCTKNSFLSSQFLRLRRLCSDDTDFEEKAEEIVEFFIQRHYPEDIVRTALQKGPNNSTLSNSSAKRQNSYRKETNHQSCVPSDRQPCTQPNWSLSQSRAELAAIFSQPPLIAYKRDTNIRDICCCDLSCVNQPQEHQGPLHLYESFESGSFLKETVQDLSNFA